MLYTLPANMLTVGAAAELLGVSDGRVPQLLADGEIQSAGRVGRSHVLRRAEVERWQAKGERRKAKIKEPRTK